MKHLLFALAACVTLGSSAMAQNAVIQNGSITVNHALVWRADRQVGDAGGISGQIGGPRPGQGLEPFAIQDHADCGLAIGSSNATDKQFCLGHNSNGDAIITYLGTVVATINADGLSTTTQPPDTDTAQVATTKFVTDALSSAGQASIPYVATNVALKALSPLLNAKVLRSGVLAAGDAPVMMFFQSPLTCAAQALVDDVGRCVDATAGGSWLADYPTAGIDTRQFGMAAGASAAANTTACSAATRAAWATGNNSILFAGGVLNINPGCDVHEYARVRFNSDTKLVLQADGPALGSRKSPGATLTSTNANYVKFASLRVDLNYHHGVPFINRAGMHVDVRGLEMWHPLSGSYVDVMAVTDTVTTVNNSINVSNTLTKLARPGMVVTDSLGCVKANTQVATATDGSSALTLTKATNASGCGANDVLSAYGVFNDGGYTAAAYFGIQGTYYGTFEDSSVRVSLEPALSTYVSGNSFTVSDATGIAAMTPNTVTAVSWASQIATYTLTSDAIIAPGHPICFDGITPAAYNGCFITSRDATHGNKVGVIGIPVDPGGAGTVFGAAHYDGAFVQNESLITGLLPYTWVTSVVGNTVTVNTTPVSLTAGNTMLFSAGAVGISFTGTGTSENPNVQTVGVGKMLGFAIGTNFYQGGNGVLTNMDHTFSGLWGIVIGGNGGGLSSSMVAIKDIINYPYLEFQGSGNGIWFTSDSRNGCAGECGQGIANFSSPSGQSAPIRDDRLFTQDTTTNNDAGIGMVAYTPTITCTTGTVTSYTNQTGYYKSRGSIDNRSTIVNIEIQINDAGTCSGLTGITTPTGHSPKTPIRQACAAINQTTAANTQFVAYASGGKISFNTAPTNPTDNMLIQCTYVDG